MDKNPVRIFEYFLWAIRTVIAFSTALVFAPFPIIFSGLLSVVFAFVLLFILSLITLQKEDPRVWREIGISFKKADSVRQVLAALLPITVTVLACYTTFVVLQTAYELFFSFMGYGNSRVMLQFYSHSLQLLAIPIVAYTFLTGLFFTVLKNSHSATLAPYSGKLRFTTFIMILVGPALLLFGAVLFLALGAGI